MEQFSGAPQALPENIPMKYLPDQVEGRLTGDELSELNRLVDELFVPEPGDAEIDGTDPRYERWLELDAKAQGI